MLYSADLNRYNQMKYQRCGKSGLLLPAVSLGLWHNFGYVDDYANSVKMLTYAFDRGITHFDLANNYGPPLGSAEVNFGKVLKNEFTGYRDELIISTKAGYTMWEGPYGDWGSRKYLLASLDQSLKRMGLDYVDIFYSHRFDPNTPLEETMGALATAVQQGKALYVGLSNYNPEQTERAVILLKQMGVNCLIHQPKYSMFVREPENGLLDTIEKNGLGCIPFSPLAQGLLTNKYLSGIPDDSRAAKAHGFLKTKDITDDKLKKIHQLNALAQSRKQTLAQMALAWVLRDKRITTVLIGASSVEQLQDNIDALKNLSFTPEELAKIEAILQHSNSA